jgi:hypothetical protein
MMDEAFDKLPDVRDTEQGQAMDSATMIDGPTSVPQIQPTPPTKLTQP